MGKEDLKKIEETFELLKAHKIDLKQLFWLHNQIREHLSTNSPFLKSRKKQSDESIVE